MIAADGATRLPVLDASFGTLVALPIERLQDGPWCGVEPNRFDADLYRLRQLRLVLRVEASAAAVRGRGDRFVHPGVALLPGASVADLEIQFHVAPRNLRVF